ncbi:MAG: dihydrolipoamide acetyltransferase family protein [Actinomycetota bacterium]
MTGFRLPDVGEGLEQAEIVEWLVREGEQVSRDQPLVEILTDKSQTQLPSPQAGVIARLAFAEGDLVTVGQVIVEYEGDADDQQDAVSADAPAPVVGTPDAAPTTTATPPARPKAAPVVRRRALEAGLDLAGVEGTGPGGRITNADLDRHLAAPAAPAVGAPIATPPVTPAPVAPLTGPVPAPTTQTLGQMAPGTHPLRGVRRVTAQSMARSWEIPHIHGSDEADATELLAARNRIKERDPQGAAQLTPLAFFVAAVANALRRYPLLNASIDTEAATITVHPDINIGIAVASDAGLFVPVIRNADQRSLYGVAAEIVRLTAAVRQGSIPVAEMQHGTATISNYGSLGGRFSSPIIRAPEVLIVGFGAIRQRPFVVDGDVVARSTLPISTAVDHRLIDGDLMTAFQEDVIAQLADPVTLLAR